MKNGYLPVVAGLSLCLAQQASSLGCATECSSLHVSPPPGATVLNTTAIERRDVVFGGIPGTHTFCAVDVYLTHGTAGDEVLIEVYLPLPSAWNGRFQGVGGSGWAAGYFAETPGIHEVLQGLVGLPPPLVAGFAAATTDAGVKFRLDLEPSGWYNNTQIVENFLHLSMHEMTIVGKDLAAQYYGREVSYSYWNGCSQGGRQGYGEAQRYPEDYDGIIANAPAIAWERFLPAGFWPRLVQQNHAPGEVSNCKLVAMTNASIEACDLLDGGADGLISTPTKCKFDAAEVVGTEVDCEDGTSTITEGDASVWNRITQGPVDRDGNRLWYGIPPGTNPLSLAAPPGFPIPQQWMSSFLLDDPSYNFDNLSYEEFYTLFEQSLTFSEVWGTDDPDLTAFKARGGKLLSYQGWADDVIMPEGVVDYWGRVVDFFGGDQAVVGDFYRLFMAPGLGHCLGGAGPSPFDPRVGIDSMDALIEWVEKGIAPETLPAGGNTQSQTRNLCSHPKELVYSGQGDVSKAENWGCT